MSRFAEWKQRPWALARDMPRWKRVLRWLGRFIMVALYFGMIAAGIYLAVEYAPTLVGAAHEDFLGIYLPMGWIVAILAIGLFGVGGYGSAKSVSILVQFCRKREHVLGRSPKVVAGAVLVVALVAVTYYFPFWPLEAGFQRFTAGPYIAYHGDNAMTISWDTASEAPTELWWGTSAEEQLNKATGSDNVSDLAPATPRNTLHHVVLLPNLVPGARYYYRIPVLGTAVWSFYAAPAPGSGLPVCFTIVADTQGGYSGQKRNVALMRADPDGINYTIIPGDLTNRNDAFHEWAMLFDAQSYGGVATSVPWMNAPGNHETYCTVPGCGYVSQYQTFFQYNYPTGTAPLAGAQGRGLYYSYNYSNVHMVSLDVTENGSALSASQIAWLRADLTRNMNMWKFVYIHYPIYSLGDFGSDRTLGAALVPIFDEFRVNAVFYGHDHHFEAFAVNTTYAYGGTYYFNVGGGGGSIDGMTNSKYGARAWPGPVLNVSATGGGHASLFGASYQLYGELAHHYMKVKVTGAEATYTAIRTADGSRMFQASVQRQAP